MVQGQVPRPRRLVDGDNRDRMDGMVEIVDRRTARAEEQEKQRFHSINRLMFPDGVDQDDEVGLDLVLLAM